MRNFSPETADSELSKSHVRSIEKQIDFDGFACLSNILTETEVEDLKSCLVPVSKAGNRGLLGHPEIKALAHSDRLLGLIRPHLATEPVPVRAIYFDKSAEANWLVPWHQDLTLAFRARCDVPGFGPWTLKDAIPHAQPPVDLLKQMLTIRLHLDDADESNGALRVLPGSHRSGRLTTQDIQQWRQKEHEVLCPVSAGGAMLMRPLLLHASSRSVRPRHRRVLHLEYAAFILPAGLEWHEAA